MTCHVLKNAKINVIFLNNSYLFFLFTSFFIYQNCLTSLVTSFANGPREKLRIFQAALQSSEANNDFLFNVITRKKLSFKSNKQQIKKTRTLFKLQPLSNLCEYSTNYQQQISRCTLGMNTALSTERFFF